MAVKHNYSINVESAKNAYDKKLRELNKALELSQFDDERDELRTRIAQLNRSYAKEYEIAKRRDAEWEAEHKSQYDAWDQRMKARELEVKAHSLTEWLKAGGTEKEFEANWETIRMKLYEEKVLNYLQSTQTQLKISL